MIVETLITKGVGWEEAGYFYWDVYLVDVQGQPSLYSGKTGSLKDAEYKCNSYYLKALREIREGKW